MLTGNKMNYHKYHVAGWTMLGCLIVVAFSFHSVSIAQEASEQNPTYMSMEFVQSGTQKKLIATLTARIPGERGRKRIEDAEIEFYNLSETSELFLGKSSTTAEGNAILEISDDINILANSEGQLEFKAVFNGSKDFRAVSDDIAIIPMKLQISFVEIDSVKNIVASAYQLNAEGEQIPVEEDVIFYVPRKFSNLKIGDVELEDGEGMILFPETLPGDSIGNLTIISRIEESRDFGTVETMAIKDWGTPRPPVIIEQRRGLGDTDAPLWMVYTLIVLLSAVWFHYMYLFYVLFSIKREGKKEAMA